MTIDASRRIATEIRDILDRHSDIFNKNPNFVREALVARINVGQSCDVDDYIDRLQADLRARAALQPTPGILRRDRAAPKILSGHSAEVTDVVALDGNRALSASEDGTLRLWDLTSGDTLRVLRGHSGRVNHVVALDGDRALSASRDGTLRLWDLTSGDSLRVLQGHSNWVTTSSPSTPTARSPRPGTAPCASGTSTSGDTLRLEGHSGWVNHVVALDGERALSASEDDTLRLWDLDHRRQPARAAGAFDWVATSSPSTASARSPRPGQHSAPVGPRDRRNPARPGGPFGLGQPRRRPRRRARPLRVRDNTLRLWDLTSGDTLRVLEGHSYWVNHVVALDGDRALSAS